MKTGVITYNVAERGRKFRGTPRNFDARALDAVINSGAVQERVKHRDMWGYYGHWPRMLFGMNPGEGGVVSSGPLAGKVVPLVPAFVTTAISSDGDGNLRHEAEFLDNAHGRLAYRAMNNRVGGFSSAIDCRPQGGVDVPVGFYGFDYVSEPNFSTNRGYALDGVMEDEGGMLLDSVVADQQSAVRVLDGLYTSLQGDYERMAQAMEHMQHVNADLVGMLASANPGKPVGEIVAAMDGATYSRPMAAARGSRLLELAREFPNMNLSPVERKSAPEEVELANLIATLSQGRGR